MPRESGSSSRLREKEAGLSRKERIKYVVPKEWQVSTTSTSTYIHHKVVERRCVTIIGPFTKTRWARHHLVIRSEIQREQLG